MRTRLLAGVLAFGLAAACSHSATSRKVAVTPAGASAAAPARGGPADPLTGLALRAPGPIVAVKIDNAVLARPYQRGLRQAAVVYQELVEGGSTRFMAIFESGSATQEVGPIRSARQSDLAVLRAYGHPAFAFSGANPGVSALVARAAHAKQVLDASYDALPGSYRLAEQRRDARNFFAVPSVLGKRRPGSGPQDIGLRFGAAVPAGPATATMSASFSRTSQVQVRYDASSGRYLLSQGGRVLPISCANVVVQMVRTSASRFHDVHGEVSPLTVSTGSGRSVVLRDGKRVEGRWSRTGLGATHFLDAAGHDVALKPGPTWVMLLPSSGGTAFG